MRHAVGWTAHGSEHGGRVQRSGRLQLMGLALFHRVTLSRLALMVEVSGMPGIRPVVDRLDEFAR